MEHRLIYRRIAEIQSKQKSTVLSTPQHRVVVGQDAAADGTKADPKYATSNTPVVRSVGEVADERQAAALQPGVRPLATLSDSYTPYKDLEEAEAQARREYQETGTVSAETTGYIQRLGGTTDNLSMSGPIGPASGAESFSLNEEQRQAQLDNALDLTKPGALAGYQELQKRYQELGNTQGRITSAGNTETDEQYANRQAAIQAEKSSILSQIASLQGIQQQSKVAPVGTAPMTESPEDPNLSALPETLQNVYSPTIDQANNQANAAASEFATTKAELAAEGQKAEGQLATDNAAALTAYKDRLKFNADTDKLARDREEEVKRQLLATNENDEKLQAVTNLRSEQVLRDQNIQQELVNRRQAAKFGINFDTGGLQWMQDEVRRGNEALSYLIAANGVASKKVSDQRLSIINGYALDMRQIDQDSTARYDDAYSAYQSERAAIRKDFSAGQKDRSTSLKEARQRYYDQLTDADKTKAKAYQDANKDLWQREYDLEKADRAEDLEMIKWEMQKEWEMSMREDSQAFQRSQQTNSQNFQLSQNTMNRMIQFKDKLNDNIRQDPALKDYRTTSNLFAVMKSAYDSKDTNLIAKDRALGKAYEKMIEPNSVVMPSEYQGVVKNAPLLNRIEGKFRQGLYGGEAFTDEERKAIYDMANEFENIYRQKALDAAGGFQIQMQNYNQLVPADFQVSPEEFLPKELQTTTTKTKNILDHYDNLPGAAPTDLHSFNIGTRRITGQRDMMESLALADQEFFASTGKHLEINSSYRSAEEQKKAYERFQRGEIALAAPPGQSLHEEGIAVDVTNWKEAEPFLIKYGFNPLPPDYRKKDPAHFSFRTVG